MASFLHRRSSSGEIGGKHFDERKLVHDTPNIPHHHDQRPSSSETVPASTLRPEGQGSGHTAVEEATNEDDDDDDSSAGQDDENKPAVLAPSRGLGKGKGLRPAQRFEAADVDEPVDDDSTAAHEAGPLGNPAFQNSTTIGKKRALSNLSSTPVLFDEDDFSSSGHHPTKTARTLDNGRSMGKYVLSRHGGDVDCEDALESSDDEHNVNADSEEKETDEDDEDYSGVNLIDDSGSDADGMEREEETFIIQDEHSHIDQPSIHDYPMFEMDTGLESALYQPMNVTDVGFSQFFTAGHHPASPDLVPQRKFSEGSTKRVRFDDEIQVSDDSSSASSELDGSFPDLFLDQDHLPPSLNRLMEVDKRFDHDSFSSSGSERSYWDVGQEDTRGLGLPVVAEDFDESSDPGSSGYETDSDDMGDTTDDGDSDYEREAAALRTPRQKSVLDRPSSAPASRFPSPSAFQRGRPPARGFFSHEDDQQAIAITNRNTKALVYYRPRPSVSFRQPSFGPFNSTTSTTNNSPPVSVDQTGFADIEMTDPVLSNGINNAMDIMFGGTCGTALDNNLFFNSIAFNEVIGPPEAFYPMVNYDQNGTVIPSEDDFDFEDDDDLVENDIKITDFVHLGSDVDATDVEQEDETDVPATPATSMIGLNGSTPAQSTPMDETPSNRRGSTSDAMLEHFDRTSVNAFRNNQMLYSEAISRTVARPVRSGRTAETVMSPLRRRKSISTKHGGSSYRVTKATGRLQSSITNSNRGPRMGTFSWS